MQYTTVNVESTSNKYVCVTADYSPTTHLQDKISTRVIRVLNPIRLLCPLFGWKSSKVSHITPRSFV
jgi:hypothetical protein